MEFEADKDGRNKLCQQMYAVSKRCTLFPEHMRQEIEEGWVQCAQSIM